MPLRRSRTATRPLNAVQGPLAVLRGFEALPRTSAQAKSLAIAWCDGGNQRTRQSLKHDSRLDERSLKTAHLWR
jgi:hypothetical protein